jgi:hypothetical protein
MICEGICGWGAMLVQKHRDYRYAQSEVLLCFYSPSFLTVSKQLVEFSSSLASPLEVSSGMKFGKKLSKNIG